jgi:hypothetical protein
MTSLLDHYALKKMYVLPGFLFLLAGTIHAQSIIPFVINSTGNSFVSSASGNYYEWSTGELPIIETQVSPAINFAITHGVLQPRTQKTSPSPYTLSFSDTELKLYPNVTTGKFGLEISVNIAGKLDLQLITPSGQLLEKRTVQNPSCCGLLESFDLSGYANGVYVVVVSLQPDMTPSGQKQLIRRGSLRVVKID